jgi:hypothetical protein
LIGTAIVRRGGKDRLSGGTDPAARVAGLVPGVLTRTDMAR